jgi:hypothetical protein
MEAQESVFAYFGHLQTLTNLMKSCGETLTTMAIVEKVLLTLNSRFDFIAVAIEESRNLDDLKLEKLQVSLESHKQWLNERKSSKATLDQVLFAQTSKKFKVDRVSIVTVVEAMVTKAILEVVVALT